MDDTKSFYEDSFSQFADFCFALDVPESLVEEKEENNSVWAADFQSFNRDCFPNANQSWFSNKEVSDSSLKSQTSKSLFTQFFRNENAVIDKCQTSLTNLEEEFSTSLLSTQLQNQPLDPVKSNDTLFCKYKTNIIKELLNHSQIDEKWLMLSSQVDTAYFRTILDYHKLLEKNRKVPSPTSSPYTGSPTINIRSLQSKENSDDSSVSSGSLGNLVDDSTEQELEEKTALPDLEAEIQENKQELMQKSVEELKNIVFELQLQANIYSELLLTELDYRDKLKRDQEVKNNFIASHVAVERKVNQNHNKKKSRYGFFKYVEDDSKTSLLTVPYIHRDGGPTTADLSLMIEILKAMERDDQNVSKLISDYVINLGNQYELQTVIQIRTENGVTLVDTSR